MKSLILIIFLLPGCLFFDSSNSVCEDTGKCSSDEVSGTFVGHSKVCLDLAAPVECTEGECDDVFMDCHHSIKISLENHGLRSATISEPTQIDLLADGALLDRVSLDEVRPTNDYDIVAGSAFEESPTFKQVLELAPGESIGLTLSFYMLEEQAAAKASVVFKVADQDDVTITSNIIKFRAPPIFEPQY